MAVSTGAAILGAAGIGAATSLIGGKQSSSAAKSAAQTQANAANQATAAQERALQEQLAVSSPYAQAGLVGQNRLMELLGLQNPNIGPSNPWREDMYLAANPDVAAAVARGEFTSGLAHYQTHGQEEGRELGFTPQRSADFGKYASAEFGGIKGFDPASLMKSFTPADFAVGMDPGYAFRVSEGNKALNASAAARGGLISGNALKAAQDYGLAAGSQEYTNAFNRYQANRAFQAGEYGNAFNRYQTERINTLAPYQSLTGQGQAAAAGQAANIGSFGSAQASNIMGAGNAQAAGQIGSANAYNTALGGIGNAAQTAAMLSLYGGGNRNMSAYSTARDNTPMATAEQGYYGPGLNY